MHENRQSTSERRRIAAIVTAIFAWAPNAIGAQQGHDPGAITQGPITEPPTIGVLRRFAGVWTCTQQPGHASITERGMMSALGNAFTLQSPTTRTTFMGAAGSLQFSRSSTGGGTSKYALTSYAPAGLDLVFASLDPSERGGAAPANIFTPTFEMKREERAMILTTKSPRLGTVIETCTPSPTR